MWFASAALPQLDFDFPFRLAIAGGIGLSGLLMCVLGFIEFRRARTTLNPLRPQGASSLVTSGIYRRTRNPMYLAFLLGLTGVAVAIANPVGFLVLPGFVIYMNRFQIEPEERALAAIFGGVFKAYCERTRRWV